MNLSENDRVRKYYVAKETMHFVINLQTRLSFVSYMNLSSIFDWRKEVSFTIALLP